MYSVDIDTSKKPQHPTGIINVHDDDGAEYFPRLKSEDESSSSRADSARARKPGAGAAATAASHHHDANARSDDEDSNVGPAKNNIQPGVENYVGKNIPVLILITVKLLTQHITGFLIVIACFVASRCANERVRLFDRRCVNGRGTIQLESLGIMAGMALNLYLLFKVIMQEDGSRNVLVFQPVRVQNDNLFLILWIVILSQFFIQFIEITCKAILAMFHLNHARRGYLYGVLKYTMTTYRWILPMPQICSYLWSSSGETIMNKLPGEGMSTHTWSGAIFDILLIVVYVVFKLVRIKAYLVSMFHSFKLAISPVMVGEMLSESDPSTQLNGKICPISHLPFSFTDIGARPILIKTVNGASNVVSEQALYCWLNMQGVNKNGFVCPITSEPLEVINGNTENKSTFRSSCTTSFHIFLM